MPHFPNRLGRQGYEFGNTERTDALRQLLQRHGAQYRTHPLNATAQHLLQLLLILLSDFDTQSSTAHTLSMRQNISEWNCFIGIFSDGHRTSGTPRCFNCPSQQARPQISRNELRPSQLAKQHGHVVPPTVEPPCVPLGFVLLDRVFELPARE
jgi:hypothetical protein